MLVLQCEIYEVGMAATLTGLIIWLEFLWTQRYYGLYRSKLTMVAYAAIVVTMAESHQDPV